MVQPAAKRLVTEASPLAAQRSSTYKVASLRPDIVIETWQTGHGWASGGSKVSAFVDDTVDYVFGTQSVKVTMNGAASSYGQIAKTYATNVDLTGRDLVLWFKAPSFTGHNNVTVNVGDVGFTNYYSATVSVFADSNKSPGKPGEWFPIVIPQAQFSPTGSPTWGNFRQFRVGFGDPTDGTSTVWQLGALWAVAQQSTFPNGVVSLSFDDSDTSLWPTVRPIMDKYGYAGTIFPTLDSANLNIPQLQELQRHGWEIGAHATGSAAHVNQYTLTQAQRLEEYRVLKEWGVANGFGNINSFAWPNGNYDAACAADARRFFATGRALYGSTESMPPVDAMGLRGYNVTGYSAANLKAFVDQAKARKQWLVFTVHAVNAGGTGNNPTTTTIFTDLIDYIAAQGVAVRPIGEVAKRFTQL